MEKSKQKFAIIILIIILAEISIRAVLTSGNYFRQNPIYLGLHLFYFGSALALLFKFKVTGWYMFVFYFGNNFLMDLIGLIYVYSSAIENSDANLGGYLTFLFPVPPLIIYAAGLFVCLRSNARELYEIKL